MAYDWSYPNIPKQVCVITRQTSVPPPLAQFSTPCADMPSNYTLQSDFWFRIKAGGKLEWQPLPTSCASCVPARHSASQGHIAPQGRRWMGGLRMRNELWQIPGASQPACRHVHSHTDSGDPTRFLSYAYLDFEGWAAGTKHESRGSSHKTWQRAIFHDHIAQNSHTLLIDKQKWNIWEFALSVQNSSPDKRTGAAFEMLKRSRLTVVSDSPSPALAKWELAAVAEISFELEQWKFLCS